MLTSMKLNICSRLLIAFLECTLKLECFLKKDQSQSLSITEINNCETGSYLNIQKASSHAALGQITY